MDFTEIERAIVKALKQGVPSLKTVEGYAGQLQQEIEKMALRLPAAYVVYGDSTYRGLTGLNIQERTAFSVLVVARARKGGEREAGAYAEVINVLEALANNDLGLDIEGLAPVRTSLVRSTGGLVVYGIEFETGFQSRLGR